MNLTIECRCGATYETEFEPVDGQVPGTINCPSCGADATDYINRVLAARTSPPSPADGTVSAGPELPAAEPPLAETTPAADEVTPLATPSPVEDEVIPAPSSAPGAEAAAESPSPADAPAPAAGPIDLAAALLQGCAKHPGARVEICCFVCKKPMCRECMENYGFVCSPYCRQRARELDLEIPVYEHQRAAVAARAQQRSKRIGLAVAALVVGLLGLWGWYKLVGSKPHVVWSLPLGKMDSPQYCRFAGPDQLVLLRHQQVTLYDVTHARPIWSATIRPLAVPPKAPAATSAGTAAADHGPATPAKAQSFAEVEFLDFGWAAGPPINVTEHDVWVHCPGGLLQFDRRTGQEKKRVPIPGRIEKITPSAAAIMVVSRTGLEEQTLTQVALGSGQADSLRVTLPPPPPRPAHALRLIEADTAGEADVPDPYLTLWRREFLAAGPNVLQFEARLVKTNIVASQAMKPEGPSAVSQDIRVTETAAMAEEILNEAQRRKTGGLRKDDASTYAVTLNRLFGPTVATWKGEVTGRPVIFAGTTVDLLVAGRSLTAFDKNNRPLWQAKLSYPIDERFGEARSFGGDESATPLVEAGQTLYFFDQGVLTAFAADSGAVRWRLPSVGISRITFDDRGLLYVSTTSASPESIQYTQQINVRDKVDPIILKIDPASGKILWKIKQGGQACHLSGRYIYFTSAQSAGFEALAAASRGGAAPVHFHLLRVAPGNGQPIWDYYQPREPMSLDFAGNRILMLYPDELQVLKFLAF